LVNLALGGIAAQSSLFYKFYPQFAIDGNTISNLSVGSCTHTNMENNPWWRVDLLAVYGIGKVIITNRGDCCPDRINGAEIHIGNSIANNGNDNPRCVVITSIPAGASVNYTCNMIGRYLNVIIPNTSQILSLCEVKVYEVNVALNGRAAQSSFYKINFNPYSVIDGSKETNLYSYHCSATNAQYNPWWRVDLLGIYNISNVIITGRSDCCTQEIIGAEIRIGSSIVNNGNNNPRCGVISSITSTTPVSYTCNMLGRYVNVIIPNLYRHLVLCEVEVFGVL
ncbi:hypothetical protein C0J50_18189, partial [Silurus asotus]